MRRSEGAYFLTDSTLSIDLPPPDGLLVETIETPLTTLAPLLSTILADISEISDIV